MGCGMLTLRLNAAALLLPLHTCSLTPYFDGETSATHICWKERASGLTMQHLNVLIEKFPLELQRSILQAG